MPGFLPLAASAAADDDDDEDRLRLPCRQLLRPEVLPCTASVEATASASAELLRLPTGCRPTPGASTPSAERGLSSSLLPFKLRLLNGAATVVAGIAPASAGFFLLQANQAIRQHM
mmetsp:Transcript_25871/g.73976  ORF Transcript_25871/g.73976 Transcript_25871/m.73976 type:complete len:116 (-) Transcript_25871:97-444(-)